LSHLKVTAPAGKPVAVAESDAPTTPFAGVTSSSGAASVAGAAAVAAIASTSRNPLLVAARRSANAGDPDLTRKTPRCCSSIDASRATPAYPSDPTSQMADLGRPRPPNR
jgi:hypothetical protein